MYQEPHDEHEIYVSQINPELEFEVTYWSRKFGVTKAALREAVERAGVRARDVRAAIAAQGQREAA
jgi:hypothetical protein